MSFVSSRYEVGANDIIDMPISDGLKEALVNCGFTRQQILAHTTGELLQSWKLISMLPV